MIIISRCISGLEEQNTRALSLVRSSFSTARLLSKAAAHTRGGGEKGRGEGKEAGIKKAGTGWLFIYSLGA